MSQLISFFEPKQALYMHSKQVASFFECSHQCVLNWVLIELPESMRDMALIDASGQGFNIDVDLIYPRDGVMH